MHKLLLRFLLVAALVGAAVAGAFAADKEAEKAEAEAKKQVQRGLAAGDKNAVVAGLNALGAQGAGKDVAQFILEVALRLEGTKIKDADSNDIYDAAEAALSQVKDKDGEAFIYDNLSGKKPHKDVRVRVFLCDVAGMRLTPEGEAALIAALGDKSNLVQKRALQHLGIRKSVKAIDPVIALLGKTEKKREEPWLDAMRFLCVITGKDFATAQDWKGWWDANKGTFDPSKVVAPTSGSGVGETVSREAPDFFGTDVLSKKCVFILDTSGSMAIKDPSPEGGRKPSVGPKDDGYGEIPDERMRMKRLKDAMVKLIKELPGDTQFTIVTFGSSVRNWNNELVTASPKQKDDAIEFAEGLIPEGFTVTDEALRAAFDVAGEPNTFYLFSDGIPQRGKNPDGTPSYIDRKDILEEVERMNRVRQVKIFTIGVGEADANFMRALATANGGTFTQVN